MAVLAIEYRAQSLGFGWGSVMSMEVHFYPVAIQRRDRESFNNGFMGRQLEFKVDILIIF